MERDRVIIDGVAARSVERPPAPRRARRQLFVAANVPLEWVKAACRAHGGIVAWALWFRHGLAKKRPFAASLGDLTLGCVSIDTARRILASLEAAGLVQVEHRAGSKSIITIIGPGITTSEDPTHVDHP